MSVGRLFVLQVLVPFATAEVGWLLCIFSSRGNWKRKLAVLIPASLLLLAVLTYAYSQTPRLVVVPDFEGMWIDPARALCEEVGLTSRPVLTNYTDRAPAGKIVDQSIPRGAAVFRSTEIVLWVSRGQPVDPLRQQGSNQNPDRRDQSE